MKNREFIFGVVAAGVLVLCAVILYITQRSHMTSVDRTVLISLIGLIGGLVFYLIDPQSQQSFKFRKIINLGGAAALGASLMFLTNWILKDVSSSKFNNDYIVLMKEAGDNSRHRFDDGTTIDLIDIISLDEKKIESKLKRINSELYVVNNVGNDSLLHPQCLEIFISMVGMLGFDTKEIRATKSIYHAYKNGQTNVDSLWNNLTREIILGSDNQQLTEKKITKMPFAILRKTKGELVTALVIGPTKTLKIENRVFGFPVIANPKKQAIPQLNGAILLKEITSDE